MGQGRESCLSLTIEIKIRNAFHIPQVDFYPGNVPPIKSISPQIILEKKSKNIPRGKMNTAAKQQQQRPCISMMAYPCSRLHMIDLFCQRGLPENWLECATPRHDAINLVVGKCNVTTHLMFRLATRMAGGVTLRENTRGPRITSARNASSFEYDDTDLFPFLAIRVGPFLKNLFIIKARDRAFKYSRGILQILNTRASNSQDGNKDSHILDIFYIPQSSPTMATVVGTHQLPFVSSCGATVPSLSVRLESTAILDDLVPTNKLKRKRGMTHTPTTIDHPPVIAYNLDEKELVAVRRLVNRFV